MDLPNGEGIKWSDIAAYFAAGWAGLMSIILGFTHKRIEAKADEAALQKVDAAVKVKADAAAVMVLTEEVRQKANLELVSQLMSRIDRMLNSQDTNANHQREDARRIYDSIKEIADAQQLFAQKAIEELGKRPTREEVIQTFERRKS